MIVGEVEYIIEEGDTRGTGPRGNKKINRSMDIQSSEKEEIKQSELP